MVSLCRIVLLNQLVENCEHFTFDLCFRLIGPTLVLKHNLEWKYAYNNSYGIVTDEVLILSVERAQLSPIPLLEDTTSSCMVTGVVPAITPPTLKLGIK